jgi:dTDP-glucose 4,6-dehydratase
MNSLEKKVILENCINILNELSINKNDLEKIVDANINKTVTLLSATKNVDYDSFINISTSSVTLETETYYSATKAGTERICKAFARENNKPIVSVRPYSVYGPGEAKNRFIPKIIQAAKYEHDLQIVMSPKHDWIYVQDFIQALYAIIPHSKELSGTHVGVGTGKETSNQKVFNEIQKIHGSKIKHNTVNLMRDYDCDSWVCDTEIIEYLGWKQQYSLGEGLKKTYDCY